MPVVLASVRELAERVSSPCESLPSAYHVRARACRWDGVTEATRAGRLNQAIDLAVSGGVYSLRWSGTLPDAANPIGGRSCPLRLTHASIHPKALARRRT